METNVSVCVMLAFMVKLHQKLASLVTQDVHHVQDPLFLNVWDVTKAIY